MRIRVSTERAGWVTHAGRRRFVVSVQCAFSIFTAPGPGGASVLMSPMRIHAPVGHAPRAGHSRFDIRTSCQIDRNLRGLVIPD